MCNVLRIATLAFCALAEIASVSGAQSLPEPLQLEQALRFAQEHRAEIEVASARADAFAQRPAIVGAPEDPTIFSSVDHYPFEMMEEADNGRRYDWSLSIEQRFALSGILGHRRRAARAQAQSTLAESERTRLDIDLQVQEAFFMLRERRRMAEVLEQQSALTEQLVASAVARYSSGSGLQADVLRAEVEAARVKSERRALDAQTRAAEAMLNARIGRSPGARVPALTHQIRSDDPPPAASLARTALEARPELRVGELELERAAAQIDVMRAMYRPMAMVRAGRASTMTEGDGAMLMIGISVPIWQGRLSAGVNEARAMERMARADLTSMRLMIEGDVITAREELVAALARREVLQHEVVRRAEMTVEASTAAYAAGRGPLFPLIEAARLLWDIRSELVMAETSVATSWARLERTVGMQREPGS